jgi:hypothetical protein
MTLLLFSFGSTLPTTRPHISPIRKSGTNGGGGLDTVKRDDSHGGRKPVFEQPDGEA